MKTPAPLLVVSLLLAAGAAIAADAPATPPSAAPAATTPAPAAQKQKAPQRPLSEVASPATTTDNVEFVIGPDYAYAPETKARDDVPKGKTYDFVMKSEESKIYPGIAKDRPG